MHVSVRRQMLQAGDPAQRLAFCMCLVNTVAQNPNFLDELVVSDEVIFSLNSGINTWNVVECAQFGNGHRLGHSTEFSMGAGQLMV